MNESPLKLIIEHRFFSPYAMWVYVTLREKSLPFELSAIDITRGEQRGLEYQRLSLTSRVPVLIHGDLALSESSAIIEYLEEQFPEPRVLPAQIKERARARQVQAWLRSDLQALREERSVEVGIFGQPTDKPLSASAQRAADDLVRVAEQLLGSQETIFESWCIVDTELALTLNRLVANGDPVPAKLQRYVQRQWARPSVQAWLRKETAAAEA